MEKLFKLPYGRGGDEHVKGLEKEGLFISPLRERISYTIQYAFEQKKMWGRVNLPPELLQVYSKVIDIKKVFGE